MRGSGPQLFAVVRAESLELAEAGAFKDQVPRGGQGSAIQRTGVVDAPDFGLLHRVPRGEMALDAGKNGFFDLRILGQARGDGIDAGIESCGAMAEVFGGFVGEHGIEDGEIDQAGLRVEGHGLPTVGSAGPWGNQRGFAGAFILCGWGFDGEAGVQVDAGGPRGAGERFGREKLAGGAIQHVEKAVLGRV